MFSHRPPHSNRTQRHHVPWRVLPTARGAFVVPWRPQNLKTLLRSEGLAPADLAAAGPESARNLARDLFLLGLQDEMACADSPDSRHSPISAFARELASLLRSRHAHVNAV